MSDESDDGALVERSLAGDRTALAALVSRSYPSLLRLCRRLLGDGAEAEDVAQDAALAACMGLSRLREPGRFGPWLHAIAANMARAALRRRRALSLEALDEAPGQLVTLWSSAQPDPAEVAVMRELHDTVVAALAELSPLSRDAVIGFYLEGYSYAELAALLGVPVGTLKGRLVSGGRQLGGRLSALRPALAGRDSVQQKEQTMEQPELVPVVIDSVRLNLATQHRAVVLRDPAGGRYLPIWIGPSEADAINAALTGQQFPRPMTHDLSLALLRPLNATVRRVTISRIADNTFFSEVEVAAGDQVHSVDARPSDALALAARAGAPIFASSELLALHEQQAQAGSEGMPGAWRPLEQGAPPPQPLRLLLVGLGEPTRHELLDELFIQIGALEVVDAPEGDVGLELATHMRWAIAIVNLGEPAQLERLRAMSEAGVKLPILALGPDDKALADQATALGARAYLVKPVASEVLAKAAREAMLEAWRASAAESP
jgi:RNA polymerase sigma factor (sigma-70 family)